MLLPSGSVFKHIVHIIIKMVIPIQQLPHHSIERSWRINQSKRHDLKLVQSLMSITKAINALSSSVIGTCQIAFGKIIRVKILVLFQLRKDLFGLQHGLRVKHSDFAKFSKVHTDSI